MKPETAVLISIRPKWCELIANGQKTLEVRKNRPTIEPPFTCYIYCTRGQYEGVKVIPTLEKVKEWRGRIIGEFVCGEIKTFKPQEHFCKEHYRTSEICDDLLGQARLYAEDVWAYSDNGKKPLYGWNITGLRIYEKPLDLSALSGLDGEPVRRAPQSWRYVGKLVT